MTSTDPTTEQPATPGQALRRAIQMATQLRDAMIGQHEAAGHALAVHALGEDCSWCVRAADECDHTYACEDWKSWQAQYETALCLPFAEQLGGWADELDTAPGVYQLPAEPPDVAELWDHAGYQWERPPDCCGCWGRVGEHDDPYWRGWSWGKLLTRRGPLSTTPPAGTEGER